MHLDDVLSELVADSGDRLLRRAVINEYVRTRRLRSSTEIVTDTVPERTAAGGLEDRAAEQAQLWAALGELSERQRAVLVLRYYEAAALSCPGRYARQAPWVPARPAGVDGRCNPPAQAASCR